MGYKIAVNLMKATKYNADKIFKFYDKINFNKIEYFYIADSYGNCTPEFINEIASKFIKEGHKLEKIGFHAHDNMDNALKNALTAKKINLELLTHQ